MTGTSDRHGTSDPNMGRPRYDWAPAGAEVSEVRTKTDPTWRVQVYERVKLDRFCILYTSMAHFFSNRHA